jgi:quinol-cytochrome oxidoreductase complex cytochrome b subunit
MSGKAEEKDVRDHFLSRVGRSIFPGFLQSLKSPEGYRKFFNTLIFHFRPRTVPARTLRFTLTWGLGGMALVLLLLLFSTGLMLKFVYQPTPGKAYESILYLQEDILFGQLIRNIHYWSANLLVIVVFLHFLRVFFTGAFHPPRQFNWVIGLGLFFLVIFSNFTGYLLPWDQLSFWAVTICGGMLAYIPLIGPPLKTFLLGGPEVGVTTLSRFYAVHTAVLPAALVILMSFHFWRVRKARGLVVPRDPDEAVEKPGETAPVMPDLILREVVTALVLIAVIMVFSAAFNAPLGDKANPGLSPNPTKAPWYFMGFQELLMHFHPLFAVFIIPVISVLLLLSIPYLRYEADTQGVWFASKMGRRIAWMAACAACLITVPGVLLDEYVFEFASWMPGVPPALASGFVPFVIFLAGAAGLHMVLKRRYALNLNETVQALFILLLAGFVVLTVIGIFFRGEGMALVWP